MYISLTLIRKSGSNLIVCMYRQMFLLALKLSALSMLLHGMFFVNINMDESIFMLTTMYLHAGVFITLYISTFITFFRTNDPSSNYN